MTLSPKQARNLKGLTQEYVAERLRVSRDTYRKWESQPDKMPVGKAKEFSNIVEKKVDEIFFAS